MTKNVIGCTRAVVDGSIDMIAISSDTIVSHLQRLSCDNNVQSEPREFPDERCLALLAPAEIDRVL
jgi:hypothetical protein